MSPSTSTSSRRSAVANGAPRRRRKAAGRSGSRRGGRGSGSKNRSREASAPRRFRCGRARRAMLRRVFLATDRRRSRLTARSRAPSSRRSGGRSWSGAHSERLRGRCPRSRRPESRVPRGMTGLRPPPRRGALPGRERRNRCKRSVRRSRGLSRSDGARSTPARAASSATTSRKVSPRGTTPPLRYAVHNVDRPSVDEESRRRRAMCDDPICSDPEHSMRHLLVRRDPAASILLPTELRKGRVEAGGERRQDSVDVEVPDPLLCPLRRCHWRPSSRFCIFVPNMGSIPQVGVVKTVAQRRHVFAFRALSRTQPMP